MWRVMNKVPVIGRIYNFILLFYIPPYSTKGIEVTNKTTLTQKVKINALRELERRDQVCAQSCQILCNPMGCGPPDSSVHGISQSRILE